MVVCSVLSLIAQGQQYILKGRVTNTNLEPLPYATVQVRELKLGTKTDASGNFEFQLEEGKYELVFSLVGYEKYAVQVVHRKDQAPLQIILNESTSQLKEVRIANFKKDRAEEIIRNVIAVKNNLVKAASSYRVQVYIKAGEKQTTSKRKVELIDATTDTIPGLKPEFAGQSLAEIFLQLDYAYPNKIKEERLGVKKRGRSDGLFFLTTTDGNFSLYPNLIQVPELSKTPMLSPISFSGLIAYKYKTTGIRRVKDATIYTIQFTPTRIGNALLKGSVDIVDTSWAIVHAEFSFPKFHMPEYESFEVIQDFECINDKAWLPVRQEFIYLSKAGKSRSDGKTIAVYSQYVLDTLFGKRYFNNELSATSLAAYEKDTTFWNTVRLEPLTKDEVGLIRYKDSLQRVYTSKPYLDSVDKVYNKITLLKIFLNGVSHFNRARETHFYVNPILNIYRPFMPGGARVGLGGSLSRTLPSKKRIFMNADLSYGLVNPNLMGDLGLTYRYNPFSQAYVRVDGGREFDFIFWGDAWINRFRRSNFYIKESIRFEYGRELVNGLMIRAAAEYANRKSIDGFKLNRTYDSLLSELVINNQPIAFQPYKAFYTSLTLEYTPMQTYIREPREKIILGSKLPTFYITWRKGIPGFLNSAIDFDYLEYGFRHKLKLGLAGISRFNFMSGTFLNQRDLRYVDYKFIARGNPYLYSNPLFSFQMMDTSFAVFRPFYEGHYIHEFNGALLNKIPGFKKLQLLEVAGAGLLYLPEQNLRYVEGFVGIERIIRFWKERFKLGIYLAGSIANKYNRPLQFKFGLERWDRLRNNWYE